MWNSLLVLLIKKKQKKIDKKPNSDNLKLGTIVLIEWQIRLKKVKKMKFLKYRDKDRENGLIFKEKTEFKKNL